jgi:hypothetical protein
MDPHTPVTVYNVTSVIEAEVIQNLLQEEGIRCDLGGAGQGGLSGVLKIDLLVAAQDAERARALIQKDEQLRRHQPS